MWQRGTFGIALIFAPILGLRGASGRSFLSSTRPARTEATSSRWAPGPRGLASFRHLRLGPFHEQDAEEFLTSLLAALAGELTQPTSTVPVLSPAPVGAPANVLDTLMGLELDVECACLHAAEYRLNSC